MRIRLNVNGGTREVDVDPTTPLLWVLRDHLGKTGTKFGCGIAMCGACTIHFNGSATRCCVVPVEAAVGAQITTIEGLAPDATHPLQQAWLELNVPQCGYCQAGMLMAAADLLKAKPRPTDADIDAAHHGEPFQVDGVASRTRRDRLVGVKIELGCLVLAVPTAQRRTRARRRDQDLGDRPARAVSGQPATALSAL